MRAVFADTFYFLGLSNRSDESHAKCRSFSNQYRGGVVTTAWILVELADGMASAATRQRAASFIRQLEVNPRVRILPPSPELLARGLGLYEDRPDKDWSLTDCISFVAMQDEGLTDALTGDHHFAQAGFKALLA